MKTTFSWLSLAEEKQIIINNPQALNFLLYRKVDQTMSKE